MVVLEVDERLVLREASVADADELFALIESNRDYLGQWLIWVPAITSVDDERDFLRFAATRWTQRAELHLLLLLDGRIIGTAGLPVIDHHTRTAEIGYMVASTYQGHGYMTRAVRVLQRFAFDELGCASVEIHCAIGNGASRAIPERLGYRLAEIRPDGLVSGADARIEDMAVYVLDADDPGGEAR